MENAIEVSHLTKRYKNFRMDDVSFSVPKGYTCGFIGRNGAGKTTMLKLLLGISIKDGGEVAILNQSFDGEPSYKIRESLGVLFDQPYFQEDWTPMNVEKAMRPFFRQWDGATFHKYLATFSLNPRQKFKTMSRGMQKKLGMAVALSHNAKLLLLDEPTSGLDPAMRVEMLDILRDYMVDGERSVLFSTHITSDLEKIADYLVHIHDGQILYNGPKDELTERYCVIRGNLSDLPQGKRKDVIGLKEHAGRFEGLVAITQTGGLPSTVVTEEASLDDIMVHMDGKDVAP